MQLLQYNEHLFYPLLTHKNNKIMFFTKCTQICLVLHSNKNFVNFLYLAWQPTTIYNIY
jgi:hypothetical protein